jgi:hypothetical protein
MKLKYSVTANSIASQDPFAEARHSGRRQVMMSGVKAFAPILAVLLLVGCTTTPNARSKVIWEIGQADQSSNEFDTRPHDDPTAVDFRLGMPVSQFPNGLGTDVGEQRSVINIHWSSAVPKKSKLLVRWSPGGSEAAEQFRVEFQGEICGESVVRTGTMPYQWRSDYFSLPTATTGDHVVSLIHLKGDGLDIDRVAFVVE